MITLSTTGRAIAVVVALAALSACSAQYRNHGYTPTDRELAGIEVGVDTRESVAEEIGRPVSRGLLQESGWYYVQSRVRHFAYRPPEEVEREVVAISFDRSDRVANIERFGLEAGRVVPLSRRVTDTNISGISLIEQLLRNFGRINVGEALAGER
ncbi:outer membrane protein assembly factor BamE [Rhodovulum sp. YNF3179]|uniref:outer membrane protein assembly factor BamE n=1 Tax=Rhodovulum sp. YNF3179 TaxID=3425127 RepID=UPI003D3540EF